MVDRPPCSRYERYEISNPEDGEERVLATWAYAMGLLGGRTEHVNDKIARLHDHKGTLFVATIGNLPAECQWAFRRAWEEIGCEPGENVEFIPVTSERWAMVWNSKRFDSDWTPPTRSR